MTDLSRLRNFSISPTSTMGNRRSPTGWPGDGGLTVREMTGQGALREDNLL